MSVKPNLDGVLDFYPRATALGKIHQELTSSLIALRNAVGNRDWNAVQIAALHCLGFGGAASGLTAVTARGERGRIGAELEFLDRLESTLEALTQPDDDDLENALNRIVATYAEVSPDTAAAFEALIANLTTGEATGADVVGELIDRAAIVRVPPSLTLTARAAVAARLRGLLSLYHAEFNRSVAHADTLADAEAQVDSAELVATVFDLHSRQFQSRLTAQLQQIQNDLASTTAEADPPASLDLLLLFLERELPLTARRQAAARTAANALRAAGLGQRAEQLGRRTAETGLLVREAFASYAAAAYVATSLWSPVPDPAVQQLIADAGTLDFETTIPNGTDTELSQLPDMSADAFIEVSGFVEGHEAKRSDDGKLISRLILSDPSSGATGDVVAVFVHLAHAGVTPGSFVRASGVFDTTPPGGGAPALRIDVLALAQLATQSFRISFYRLAEPFFEVWRNGANIYWAVGPHLLVDDGTEIDEAASSFGAGELLFVPFIRE